jgi:hypothetical protein
MDWDEKSRFTLEYVKYLNYYSRLSSFLRQHDTTIVPILSFLGVNHPHQPPFASALFFDVYQQGLSH